MSTHVFPMSTRCIQLVYTAQERQPGESFLYGSTLTYILAGYVTLAPLKHSYFDFCPCYTVRAVCLHCHAFSLCTTCLY